MFPGGLRVHEVLDDIQVPLFAGLHHGRFSGVVLAVTAHAAVSLY